MRPTDQDSVDARREVMSPISRVQHHQARTPGSEYESLAWTYRSSSQTDWTQNRSRESGKSRDFVGTRLPRSSRGNGRGDGTRAGLYRSDFSGIT